MALTIRRARIYHRASVDATMLIAPSKMLPSENRRVICDVTFREARIGVRCTSDRVSDSLTKDVPMEYSARSLRQSLVRYARHTSALLSVALILCGILPVGAWLLWPLEESQPPARSRCNRYSNRW